MKKANPLFSTLIVLTLLLGQLVVSAQDDTEKEQEYMTVTMNHWNPDKKDFKLSEWKALEKEYFEKVIMKNEYIMGHSVYMHNMSEDNTELLVVNNFASWNDIGKFAKRSAELEKEAWPDEAERKAYFKKISSYYTNEHSDEIYAPISGAKHMTEKPTKDMLCYVRKSHFAFPEDGSMEEFEKLRKEGHEKLTLKNEYIKAYYPNVHAWGSDKTEFMEAYFLDSLADLDKMFDRDDELMKAAFPDNEENKAKIKAWQSYFTGVHGDYLYTWIHDMSK
ncbi:hypothetical protein FPF71_03770 [Algibacter amylolyticus]|uniref:ABM domain-containing protein n=1 Tax=Algibacter amylolyticus TaxID=1608400 RepID=A0A5M7BI58_9FLAO|nr:hypothetical protein [Algibacter amylolyticus]KAA5827968.1 hypothetical protein F2B50_03770 [Algibacter amylolyticus]MBB5267206.1 hypothetical protein [Algibacter amylolyticus]TSJ82213.1 hypothetical protein FPF71_03770 [Algibacter amylolyticus]